MPVQELLVSEVEQLQRPCGVLFDPPCQARDEDLASWNSLIPDMAKEMNQGRYIMVLVQCRNTRKWDSTAKQYKFSPAEDYVIASYSLAASLGKPYEPGYVANQWLDHVERRARDELRTHRINADCIQVFQCSKAGCKLSSLGLMKLITFNKAQGKSQVEAFLAAKQSMGNPNMFGWQGQAFPELKRNPWRTPSAPDGPRHARVGGHRG